MASEPDVGDLLAAASIPMGDLIASIGGGIAEAQEALDQTTLARALALLEAGDSNSAMLRALGWRPTWYHIPEAEANIQLTLSIESFTTEGARPRMRALPLNAGNSTRYGFDLNLASSLRFKVVPVPAPEAAEQLRRVPPLVGLSAAEAEAALASAELVAETRGEGAVVRVQLPEPGAWLRAGQVVTIELGA